MSWIAECDTRGREFPTCVHVTKTTGTMTHGATYVPIEDGKAVRAENAKLLEQMEQLVTLLHNDCDIEASWDGLRRFWSIELTEDGCLMRDRVCKAEAENAKLRELCADMLWTIKHAHGWYKNDTHEMLMTDVRGRDGEPTNVSHSLTTDEEMYEKRMRELGVEVDA